MLELIICGVEEVDENIDDADAVISIMTPGYTIFAPRTVLKKEQENRHSVLRLEFDDTWSEIYQLGEEMVTADMIGEILDFGTNIYDQYGEGATMLIHCHQGISRSSGIAIALLTHLTGDPQYAAEKVNEVRPQAVPNIEVIRVAYKLMKMNNQILDQVWQVFYQSYLLCGLHP